MLNAERAGDLGDGEVSWHSDGRRWHHAADIPGDPVTAPALTPTKSRHENALHSELSRTFAGQTSKSRQVFSIVFRPDAASGVRNPPSVRPRHRTTQSPQIARIPDVHERPKEWPCKRGKNAIGCRHRLTA
jgi:hypothetical protein